MSRDMKECHGFSFAECLVVLACLAVCASMTLPNIQKLQQEWALWGGTVAVESSLQWGRMHAVSSNSSHMFKVSPDGVRYCWVDIESGKEYINSVRTLPYGLKIASQPGKPLRFYQHGNAVPAGTYVIAGAAGSYSVVVSPGGRIRTERN